MTETKKPQSEPEVERPPAGAKPRETYQAHCHALLPPKFKRHCKWVGPIRATIQEAKADYQPHAHPQGGGWSIRVLREA